MWRAGSSSVWGGAGISRPCELHCRKPSAVVTCSYNLKEKKRNKKTRGKRLLIPAVGSSNMYSVEQGEKFLGYPSFPSCPFCPSWRTELRDTNLSALNLLGDPQRRHGIFASWMGFVRSSICCRGPFESARKNAITRNRSRTIEAMPVASCQLPV